MSDTLESIGRAAAAWRATRGHRGTGERLPDAVKRRAIQLVGQHTPRQVARAVGVSDARLVERWCERFEKSAKPSYSVQAPALSAPSPAFVEMTMPSPVARLWQQAEGDVQLELVGPQGVLRLRGGLDPSLVRALAVLALGQAGGQS